MKKFTILVFGVISCLFFFLGSPTVEAEEESSTLLARTIEGTLTSDTGEVMPLVGEKVETPKEKSLYSLASRDTLTDLQTKEISYAFNVYSTQEGILTNIRSDNSRSVRVTLTIDYTETISGARMAKVNQVRGSYARLDPTVSMTNAELTYGSVGFNEDRLYVTQRKTQSYVPSNFSFRTFFPSLVHEAGGGLVGASFSMDIGRGTGSWSINLSTNLF